MATPSCAQHLSPGPGKLVRTVHDEWTAAGRNGRPRLVCQVNVALGLAFGPARSAIAAYYGRDVWSIPIADPGELVDTVAAYRDFGADELVLYCYADDPVSSGHSCQRPRPHPNPTTAPAQRGNAQGRRPAR
jgi:hypothetical protein